jgi:hypothetical protein
LAVRRGPELLPLKIESEDQEMVIEVAGEEHPSTPDHGR